MKKTHIGFIALLLLAILLIAGWMGFKEQASETDFDVVVFGGEPEGVAAAVSAARNGSKTLLISEDDSLGGLMTDGMLNFLDVSSDKNGNPANAGIFAEWHEIVGGQVGFDIETAEKAFHQLVDEEDNLSLMKETQITETVKEGKRLSAIGVTEASGESRTVTAKRFIDSTKDGDLAVKAGAPYFTGGGDMNLEDRKMAVTLMIHLKGVDWEGLQKASKEGVFGGGEVSGNVAWGYGDLHFDYKAHYAKDTRLRGLNIVRQSDGTIVINALQIFGVDGLDPASKKAAIEMGKEEIRYIVEFLRNNFPGFEKAEVASYPEELYIRETRHIKAEYQLPLSDVWENKDHWDSIGFGAYPVDEQATSIEDYGAIYSDPVQYAIPFRSLVPQNVDGLLVASKAAGYSSLAAGSARVLPTGMTAGEAAGAAAAISINEDMSLREMSKDKAAIKKLQRTLKEQGANLYSFDLGYSYEGEWFYPEVRTLLNLGLVKGAYENKLPVERPMVEQAFANVLMHGANRISTPEAEKMRINLDAMQGLVAADQELSRDKAAELILAFNGITAETESPWDLAVKEGFVDNTIAKRLKEDRPLTGAEAYYLIGKALKKIQ